MVLALKYIYIQCLHYLLIGDEMGTCSIHDHFLLRDFFTLVGGYSTDTFLFSLAVT